MNKVIRFHWINIISVFLFFILQCNQGSQQSRRLPTKKSDSQLAGKSDKSKKSKNSEDLQSCEDTESEDSEECDPNVPASTPVCTDGQVLDPSTQTCQAPSTDSTFTVSGTIVNLKGMGLTLSLNNEKTKVIEKESLTFSFDDANLKSGDAYHVVVSVQPTDPVQTCTLSNDTGTVANSDIANLALTCVDSGNPISVAVEGLPDGETLGLSLNGTDTITIAQAQNGSSSFTQILTRDADYEVLVSNQPQSVFCAISNGSGKMPETSVVIGVSCAPRDSLRVSVTVSGLVGTGLKLSLNDSSFMEPTSNGEFYFSTALRAGDAFDVRIVTQPSSSNVTESCQIDGVATGTMADQNTMRNVLCESTPNPGVPNPEVPVVPITYSLSSVFEASQIDAAGTHSVPAIMADKSFCLLQKIIIEGLESSTDGSTCETTLGTTSWTLAAVVESARATPWGNTLCSSQCLSWSSGLFNLVVSDKVERSTQGEESREINVPAGSAQNTFCGLSRVEFKAAGAVNEWAECKTDFNTTLSKWFVYSSLGSSSDSRAACTARCLTWPTGANVTLTEQKESSQIVTSSITLSTGVTNTLSGTKDSQLAEADHHFCFLTKVRFSEANASEEQSQCKVLTENGFWILRANVTGVGGNSDATCSARCIRWE